LVLDYTLHFEQHIGELEQERQKCCRTVLTLVILIEFTANLRPFQIWRDRIG
jgi:hypothetical protein